VRGLGPLPWLGALGILQYQGSILSQTREPWFLQENAEVTEATEFGRNLNQRGEVDDYGGGEQASSMSGVVG
jgi:hypothetical protein